MTELRAPSRLLSYPRLNPSAALRLFCFPYAGGASHIFRAWPQSLPPTVEVCPVNLPGRGNRLLEPPFTNLTLLVQSIAQSLLPHLSKPFAFFGHSMGAIISFELARYLRKEQSPEPVHLFVSGRRAPQALDTEPSTYNLPEAKFLAYLRRLNGTPGEILEHPELMRLMLPLLRADFELVETYSYSKDAPLNCSITALGGLKDDRVKPAQLEAWRKQTSGHFSLQMLPGGHFYLHTAEPLLLEILSSELKQLVNGIGRTSLR